MKGIKFYLITILAALSLFSSSCEDNLPIDNFTTGDGEAKVTATVQFRPLMEKLGDSRSAPGNAISYVNDMAVLLYDSDGNLLKLYNLSSADFFRLEDSTDHPTDWNEDDIAAEARTARYAFTVPEPIKFGKYYMYVAANVGKLTEAQVQTPDDLRNLRIIWNSEDEAANSQMFGYFVNGETGPSSPSVNDGLGNSIYEAPLITISSAQTNLHAWLRRAASKVTVAYDGTNLKDGVSVYIMAASIRHIPKSCLLGATNSPDNTDSLEYDGGIIKYFEGDVQPGLDNFLTRYKAIVNNQEPTRTYGSDHSETAEALFFYENMQGTGKDKRQNAPGPGNGFNENNGIGYPDPDKDIAGSGWKDDKPYGTYIEVDAIYRSENPERPGTGIIKYRFMLGKDVLCDYNAERNHHYKLTLKFNNFANDYDWHIEYKQQVLEVSKPKVMNYQGKVFIPEFRPGTLNYNYGHNFEDNSVTVTSYIEDGDGKLVNWDISFDEDYDGIYTETCSWLEPVVSDGYLPYVKNVSFKFTPDVKEVRIDDLLKGSDKGTELQPYNLANPGEKVEPRYATIKNTANCYMVDAPGYYLLPLVYGNAIQDSRTNNNAYEYSGEYTGDQILSVFKDYLGNKITDPYIKKDGNPDYTPQSAFLLWEDEKDLIKYDCWVPNDNNKEIRYIPEAYGGIGGILFHIESANIQQGNAVIALGAGSPSGTSYPPIMWSWHIWVTNFSFLDSNDKNIKVTSHDPSQTFQLLPVNLGWCSGHDDIIKYYKARKCRVRFKAGAKEEFIELEQKSHIAFTRGNNPYYQWGRKDPFVAATDVNINKTRYLNIYDWAVDKSNPGMFFDYSHANDKRYTTREAVDKGELIKKPHLWHNPRRKNNPEYDPTDEEKKKLYPYLSDNEIYRNLWQGRIEIQPGSPSLKTIYDPCPVGYQVPHVNAISGFTTTGDNTDTPFEWYDVRIENIADYDTTTGQCGKNGEYSKGLYEFYTSPEKVQSIIFPETGYRDWDDYAAAYQLKIEEPIGYIWTAGNKEGDDNNSYNFEFSRLDYRKASYIRPKNFFYPCDGFPIRPCAYETQAQP